MMKGETSVGPAVGAAMGEAAGAAVGMAFFSAGRIGPEREPKMRNRRALAVNAPKTKATPVRIGLQAWVPTTRATMITGALESGS